MSDDQKLPPPPQQQQQQRRQNSNNNSNDNNVDEDSKISAAVLPNIGGSSQEVTSVEPILPDVAPVPVAAAAAAAAGGGGGMTTPPPPAAAASASVASDATIAQVLQAVEMLTSVFGFDVDVASQAVQAVGTDVTAAYNFILDAGLGADKGGAILPIDNCPHITAHVRLSVGELPSDPMSIPCTYNKRNTPNTNNDNNNNNGNGNGNDYDNNNNNNNYVGRPKSEITNDGTCPMGENWLCLDCGVIRCSRYVNCHGLAHWEDTKTKTHPEGHCIAVSLADLSVWCYCCSAYLRHPSLDALVLKLEQLKFPTSDEPEAKKARASNDNEYTGIDTDDDDISRDDLNNTIPRPARGFPINLNSIDSEAQQDVDDDEQIEYPFGVLPKSLKEVAEFIKSDKCQNIAILAGAGMSVASGIPDFRSADGLYATMNPDLLTADPEEKEAIRMDPSVALDHSLFINNPLPCLELNRDFILGTHNQQWKATLAHRFVELLHSKLGKLVRLYTQNIDGLEDQCTTLPRDLVVNVHGTMDRAECALCGTEADFETFCQQIKHKIKDLSGKDPSAPLESTPIDCPVCGYFTMKPAIVLFRSSLPKRFFDLAPMDVPKVDLMIIIGTSLRVAPANTLVFRVPSTAMRLIINRDPVGIHLGVEYDYFGGDAPRRDYFAAGDIEPTVLELMTRLGWLSDLEPLLANDGLPESSATLLRQYLEQKQRGSDNNTTTTATTMS